MWLNRRVKKIPILVVLPHSTSYLPEKVITKMRISKKIRDGYFDVGSKEVFDLPNLTLKLAKYSRLYCDLNRAPDQVGENNMKNRKGVVLLRTMQGYQVYKKFLEKSDYLERIKEYEAYFAEVKKIIKKEKPCFLIAAHTMLPHHSWDIVISNNDHCTCSANAINLLKFEFEKAGYSVSINNPFKGGFLINYFCHRDRLRGIQIEFSRRLIADKKSSELKPNLLSLHNKKITQVIQNFYKKIK